MKSLLRKVAFTALPAVAVLGIFGSFAGAASDAKKCYKLEWCPV
ncbi:MAG: hypothetical protein AAF682_04120 [Planctomycetota bacterium]